MKPTSEHHAAISGFLEQFRKRDRRLTIGECSAHLLGVAVAVSLGMAVALSVGVGTRLVGLVGAAAVALGVAAAIVWIGRHRWPQSETIRTQARHVEGWMPGLRGRLLTVLDRAIVTDGIWSQPLLERAADHARQAVAIIDPRRLHPVFRVQRAWAIVGVATLLVFGGGTRLPVSPAEAISVVFGSSAASIRLADSTLVEAADAAVVGDIYLRYVYPEYTGLEPKSVPNSDGTIIAPPGTAVTIRARTATAFQAVAIEVEGSDLVDGVLDGGRAIACDVTVEESGRWRFLLFQGDEVTPSAWYALNADADAPPVVVLSKSGEINAPLDVPFGLGWQVTDDYGVVRVSLEVESESAEQEQVLREPIDAPLTLDGVASMTPRSLGLTAGQTVVMRVVAVDNNRAEGGNRGESEALTVNVLGPRGYGRNLTAHYERLLDAMLMTLADFLEEPVPPVNTRPQLVRWAHTAAERFDPVRRIMEDQWGDTPSSGIDGMLVSDVLEASASLFRFTLTTFDREVGAIGQQPVSGDIETFASLHADTVVALETASFVLDTMIREVGVSELTRMARKTADAARDVADDAQAVDDIGELNAQLDRLARRMNQLRKAAADLSDEALRDFTNSTLDQAGGLMDETRKALAEGRIEEARRMMDGLAEQLAQFAESLEDRQQRGSSEANDMKERFEALMADLDALSAQQDEVAEELAAMQQDFGASFAERMELWSTLDRLSKQLETATGEALSETRDGRGWRPFTLVRLQEFAALGAGIRDSVRARDAQGTALRVGELLRDAEITAGFVRRDAQRSPGPADAGSVQAQIGTARRVAAEMADVLAQLEESPGQSNPEMETATRAMSDRQGQLQDWQRELMDEVKAIEGAIPTAKGDAARSMNNAGGSMESAREFLEEGVAIAAEGHQREAAGMVRETKEHLQQAMQDQQQMQQAMRQMQGEKGGSDGEDMTNQAPQNQPEIPSPELFKTPEAYREALLEGMAGDVPEEFKSLKDRFYEDLVRQ